MNEGHQENEIVLPLQLKVVEVDKNIFEQKRLLANKGKPQYVNMSTWVDVDSNTPIINDAGAPCNILYARDNITGETICGHTLNNTDADVLAEYSYQFPIDSRKLIDVATVSNNGVIIPNSPTAMREAVETTTYLTRVLQMHQNYQKMLDRIKELNNVHGGTALTVFLFGQNFYHYKKNELIDELQSTFLNRIELSADLSKRGIAYNQIQDYRADSFRTYSDNTILIPNESTIYLHRDSRKPIKTKA